MRHFLSVVGAIAGNFILWSLITKLPVHAMIIFCLVIAVGCLMLYTIVHFGKRLMVRTTIRQRKPNIRNKSIIRPVSGSAPVASGFQC